MDTIDRIRELCKEKGTSIKALEAKLGYGNGTLAKSKSIKADRLAEIADFFGVSVGYLINGEEEKGYYINEKTAEAAQEILESKELSMLFDAARDADPEDLNTVYQMLLALKRKEHRT